MSELANALADLNEDKVKKTVQAVESAGLRGRVKVIIGEAL